MKPKVTSNFLASNKKMYGPLSIQCRICLAQDAEISLFGSEESKEIVSKLSLCVNEQIEDKDGYPRNICKPCNDTLNIVYMFLKNFKESKKLFEKAFKIDIKKEFVEIIDNNFTDDFEGDVKHEETIKNEPKIEFDNAQQFLELLKPFHTKIKKEIKKESKRKIKKENKQAKIKKENGKNNNISKTSAKKKPRVRSKPNNIRETADCVSEDDGNETLEQITIKDESETVDIEFEKNTETEKKKLEPRTCVLCDACGDVFKTSEQLKTHRVKVHLKDTIQCPICQKSSSSEYALTRHIRRVHTEEDRNFVCSACGKTFAFKSDLNSHYKGRHAKHLLKKKKYPCKLCDRLFACAKSVLMHERSAHTGERPAVCSICEARFYHEDYLKEHMRLHTGETPFKCPICGRGYAQRGNMKSHIRHNHSISKLDEMTLKSIKPSILRLLKP